MTCSAHSCCSTLQVYDYASIREWFQSGNRRDPKTNLVVHDAQVTAGLRHGGWGCCGEGGGPVPRWLAGLYTGDWESCTACCSYGIATFVHSTVGTCLRPPMVLVQELWGLC